MKNLLILLGFLTFPIAFLAREKKILSLEEALKQHKVSVRLVSKGGHKGRVLSGKFMNLTDDSMYIRIEPGRRFDSKENNEQDLLMAEEMILAFSKKQKKNAAMKVFCCQAHNRSPQKDSIYYPGKLGNQELVALAEFISKEKFSDQSIQAAVWTVSDKNHPASIYDNSNVYSSERLQEFTCKLIHYEAPWYHLSYNQQEDHHGYIDQRAVKIYGDIFIENEKAGIMDAFITDAKGNRIVEILRGHPVKGGGRNFNFDFSVDGWPKKEYIVVFLLNGKEISKKPFSL